MDIEYVEAYTDNYIWLIRAPGDRRRVVAVDPGDAAPVEAWLAGQGATLAAILVTHRHWDHVDGVEPLVARWGCPVWGPANEPVPRLTTPVREGDVVEVEGLRFEVLDIPGHTKGHIAFVGGGVAFVGDTLFAAGCGRMFEGTPEMMQASLAKLRALPPDTLIYCAHEYTEANLRFVRAVDPGNPLLPEREAEAKARRARGEPTVPTRLSTEIASNPFLRWDAPEIQVAIERHTGKRPKNTVEVFARVRLWKDNFA